MLLVKVMDFISLQMEKINYLKSGILERCLTLILLIDIFNLSDVLMVSITEVIDIQIQEDKLNIHKISLSLLLWVMGFSVL